MEIRGQGIKTFEVFFLTAFTFQPETYFRIANRTVWVFIIPDGPKLIYVGGP